MDILVLGNYGSKHTQRSDKLPTDGKPPAPALDEAIMRECHSSICVVRATCPVVQPNQRIRWLMATDGSHASAIGFCLLINHLARPADIVDVVAVTTGEGQRERQLVGQYQEYLRAHGIEGEAKVKIISIRETTSMPEGIISAAEEADAAVLVLGIAGYSSKKLGSMSDYILRHCPRSVLVLKDAVEVAVGRSSHLVGADEEFLSSSTLTRNRSISRTSTNGRRSIDIKPGGRI